MRGREAKLLANQQIFEALESWGLQPQKDGNSIICGLGPLRAQCVDVQISHGGQLASLIIDLIIDPASNLKLRENVMQFADSTEKAIGGAAYLWTVSVFVAVAALLDAERCPGHMAGQEEREFPDYSGIKRPWKIFSSPFMMLGESDSIETNRGLEAENAYQADTLPLIEPFLPDLCREPRVVSVKTFLINSGIGEIHGDCSINGVSSAPLTEAVKAFAWPPGQGMRYLRQFHVLAPADFQVDMTIPTPKAASENRGLLGRLFGRN